MGAFATSNPTGSSDVTGSGTANQVSVWASASSLTVGTIPFTSSATGYAIGSLVAEPGGLLSLTSTTQGFFPPRMTTAQRNSIAGAEAGLIVFNASQDALSIYTAGGGWDNVVTTESYPTSFAVGDILYASTTSIMSRLAISASNGTFLRATNDSGTFLPAWSTLILPNSATSNQIVYASATNTYGGSSTFLWNGTSFLVGTATQIGAGNVADFFRNQNGATSVWTTNNTSGTAAFAMNAVTADNGTTNTSMRSLSAGYTTAGMLVASTGVILTTCTAGMNLGSFSNAQLSFWTNNTSRASFTSAGLFGVGVTATSTVHIGGSLGLLNSVSSAGTLTLGAATVYVFSGTTTTWTLPAIAGITDRTYFIKNRGSGAITLNSASANQIYDTAVVSSITINAGEAVIISLDGTYWVKM